MDHFAYQGHQLYCEQVPLKELALQFGTPVYVYSHATLERHYRVYVEAFAGRKFLLCYAAKANSNSTILRLLERMGAGADVVSGGELFTCLEAGVLPHKIVFSGVGKTLPEIEYALRRKILMLNVESRAEFHHIADIADSMSVQAPISLRLNPDVDPKTHPYISTGLREHKFGLTRDEAMTLYREAHAYASLSPIGLSLHIGSQLLDLEPFVAAIEIAVDVIRVLRKKGIQIEHLDLGGGLGVRYLEENPPLPKDYAKALSPLFRSLDLKIIVEPGRSIVGNAGVLLCRVIHVKERNAKHFVVIDAGMNDLLRPALYSAHHEIVPVMQSARSKITADVVGPICESADFLGQDVEIEEPIEGDFLCVRTAGAYGFAMSSHYNGRPRAAEVLVRGEEMHLIRERESFDDLIRGESYPPWLEGLT